MFFNNLSALHLHPLKQKHFWRIASRLNNNQLIVITYSPYFVNLDLFKEQNRLINIRMIHGESKVYPKKELLQLDIQFKSFDFRPEIFFSNCNILVEGRSDAAALAAISDSLGNIFEKYSIHLVDLGGKDVLEKYVPLLKAYLISHIALTDYDYLCDENKSS